jgi:hypothetical protein
MGPENLLGDMQGVAAAYSDDPQTPVSGRSGNGDDGVFVHCGFIINRFFASVKDGKCFFVSSPGREMIFSLIKKTRNVTGRDLFLLGGDFDPL